MDKPYNKKNSVQDTCKVKNIYQTELLLGN